MKIAILMSTYNGEKYLEEQLNSLLMLDLIDDMHIDIYIRDDGSKDNTKNILEDYKRKNKNIFITYEENLGPANSFFKLLKNVDNYDYYSFCDQDDVWLKGKIKKAIYKMKKYEEKPVIYFSAVNVVNQNLNFIIKKELDIKISLGTSFIINPAIGCTMVINRKMKDILNQYSGEILGMHDSWIYRVGLAINANIIYDNESYILYRQHENNVMGIETNLCKLEKLKRIMKKKKNYRGKIAKIILENYNEKINGNNKKILNQLYLLSKNKKNNLFFKLKIILSKDFDTKNKKKNLKFKYDVLFNRI